MIKICVFSDSHGCPENLIAAVEREGPAVCFFLGDGQEDLADVQTRFPALPFYAVRGNCDVRSELSASLTCAVGGVTVFAVHGHRHDVKHEPRLDTLADAARAAGASVALYGHTHRAQIKRQPGLLLMNPGSVGRCFRPTYGLLFVENGTVRAELKRL